MRLTVQQWLENSPDSTRSPHPPFHESGDISFGTVRYDETEQMIRVQMGGHFRGTYDMAVDRILSGRGLLDFVFQIHHKEWCTGQHIKDLLDCLTCYTYREHNQFPQMFFDSAGGMNAGLDSV